MMAILRIARGETIKGTANGQKSLYGTVLDKLWNATKLEGGEYRHEGCCSIRMPWPPDLQRRES